MRVFLAIVLAIAALGASAQKATVDRVELTNNIAASKYPKYDLNGRTAALVIVQLIDDNVEFKGSVLEVVKQTGEYWVYMGVGAKELHIHSSKVLPVEIRFPEYGIPRLESAATYAVTVQLPAAAAAPAQSAATGHTYLLLSVEPADAKVTVDGAVREVRNGKVRVLLRKNATYDYMVEAAGHIPEQGRVAIGAEKVERTVALRSSLGSLAVTTATPGTEIYLNGTKVATGSWQTQLEPGEYLVEGRLDGFFPQQQRVSITTGGSASVAIPALSSSRGTLSVAVTTPGTEIYIDGTKVGTDSWQGQLDPGEYLVEGRRPNYTTASARVAVATGETATVTLPALSNTKGVLSVTTATAGTEIYLNGERTGTSNWQGDVAPGDYLVEGRLAAHRPAEQLVSVSAGQTATVAIPALQAITGSLNVDYEPEGAAIAIDGTAAGSAPDVIDNIIIGDHTVLISSLGYMSTTHRVSIAEGELATISGALTKAPVHGSATPSHLSLCAVDESGNTVYISQQEWKKLKPAEKATLTPRGVVILDGNEAFAVALHDAANGTPMTWYKAIDYYLPSEDQGKIIAANHKTLNKAITAFGGEPMKRREGVSDEYWTKDTFGSSKECGSHASTIDFSRSKPTMYLSAKNFSTSWDQGCFTRETYSLNSNSSINIRGSKKPTHLSLCVTNSAGSTIYFSPKKWVEMRPEQRAAFVPKGVCWMKTWKNYMVSLKDEENKMNWEQAKNMVPYYKPFLSKDDVDALNDAILLLGGQPMSGVYWLGDGGSYESKLADCMDTSNVDTTKEYKTKQLKVRRFYQL